MPGPSSVTEIMAGRLHPHRDEPFAAAMLDRILDQIRQRPLQRSRIASHLDLLPSVSNDNS